MRFILRGLLRGGVVLVLAFFGLCAVLRAYHTFFYPPGMPALSIERDGENIVLRAYPDIPEAHNGANWALREAGIPCDTACTVHVGKTYAAVLSMRVWDFWEKRQKDPRFWGGINPGPLLLVPVCAILEAYDVVGQPTNAITSRIVDLRPPLVQPKNAGQQK